MTASAPAKATAASAAVTGSGNGSARRRRSPTTTSYPSTSKAYQRTRWERWKGMARKRPDPWTLHRLTFLVLVAAALGAGALIGLTFVVGVDRTLTGLVHPIWLWLLLALAGEAFAYVGYT